MSLRQRAVHGARWLAISTVVTTVIQFGQLSALARLLAPSEFGLMAMVFIVVSFAQLFEQMGLSEALIQRANPTAHEISSLFWLNVCAGCAAFVLVWSGSPLISRAFGEPRLQPLIAVVAVTLLIHPAGAIFNAFIRRQLRFGLLAIVDISAAATSASVAICSAAVFGQGVWSLVWGALASAVVQALGCIAYGWGQGIRIRLHFSVRDLRGYLQFGAFYVGSMVANFFNSRVDQVVIGALLGSQALGYYRVASQLTTDVIQKVNPILTRVAFPVLSRVNNDVSKLRSGYLQLVNLLTVVNAPLFIGLAVVAPQVVPLLLGQQWTPAVELVQVLCWYALIRSVGNAGGVIVFASGRSNWAFRWNLAILAVAPAVMYAATQFGGAIAVAWALVIMQLCLFLLYYVLIVRRIVGACFAGYVKAAGKPMVLGATMGLVLIATAPFLSSLNTPLLLFVKVLLGAIVYVGLLWMFQRDVARQVIALFTQRK